MRTSKKSVTTNNYCNIFLFTESFKNFFLEFCQTDDEGGKFFKYSEQLTKLAHREQVRFSFFTFRSDVISQFIF